MLEVVLTVDCENKTKQRIDVEIERRTRETQREKTNDTEAGNMNYPRSITIWRCEPVSAKELQNGGNDENSAHIQ